MAMEEQGLSGTVRLYGCAAEETEGAKVYMARAGLFDDLDAALHWHPSDFAGAMYVQSTAVNLIQIEFFGTSAHAAVSPWSGRSAVHAAELFAHALNVMREHVEPTARIHYIYQEAGLAHNVVPDYAKILLGLRDIDRARVDAMTQWVGQMVEGAALATQTKGKMLAYFGLWHMCNSQPLAEVVTKHLERLGMPSWTAEEQAWAKEAQKNFGVEPKGLMTRVMPLPAQEISIGGSTDVGDVSWCTPTMGVVTPCEPIGVPIHSWAATASHAQSFAIKSAVYAAKALAATGLDLMTDESLRKTTRADWEQRRGGITYTSPIPPEQEYPLSTPQWLLDEQPVSSRDAVRA
jgi:aminobenzoyl-glutamate utilization protein B